METEYLAIIITISVLGGVVLVSCLTVCITKIVTDRSLRKSLAKGQVLRQTVTAPSYVRYNDPEPQTPIALAPEGNPWESDFPGYHTNPSLEYYIPDSPADSFGQSQLHVPPPDLSRRPSDVQDRQPSVQNIPRRSSYVQDLPPMTPYEQDMPRRTSYAEGVQRRPSHAQGMPRTRYSYAPELGRRPSQAVQRRSSMVSQIRPQPPGGELWFNYLRDDPEYFTAEGLEWNKMQPRVWQGRSRDVPPPAPHYALDRRMGEAPSEAYHRQAASRLSWI